MIKSILFDMDGVLIDADKWHFNALNIALQHGNIEPISWAEHLTIYKGIPTQKKLEILTERKGLSKDLYQTIVKAKQEMTVDIINKFCCPDPEKIAMMRLLKNRFTLGVCSNSIRSTVELMLRKSGLLQYIDFYLSSEDISQPKPSAEIYNKAVEICASQRNEIIAVEDSDVGRAAVEAAGIRLCAVTGPQEVNFYRIITMVQEAEQPKVVIPAAGLGKRFSEAGYIHPKPFIDILGRPMISWVLDNLKPIGQPIVILQQRHIELYCGDKIISNYAPGAKVVGINGLTEGAACTVLKAESLIDNSNELIIANSDQYLNLDLVDFIAKMRLGNYDGGIITFQSDEAKWSYARIDEDGLVVEVAEKKVISPHATAGIYYFKTGRMFVEAAKRMLAANIRVNNEYYVCPVYNQILEAGAKVAIYEIPCSVMYGLGTPEDLIKFLNRDITDVSADTVISEKLLEGNQCRSRQDSL